MDKLFPNCKLLVCLFLLLSNLWGNVTCCKKGAWGKDYQMAGMKIHNRARRHHNTEEMSLDDDLNKRADKCAQYYINIGKINHSCKDKNGAGENLYWSKGMKQNRTAEVERAVRGWYSEIKRYDFGTHQSTGGPTGHFTQVVWKSSTQLGIGYAHKDKETVVVGLYKGHGNVGGGYRKNVMSPKGGKPADLSDSGHLMTNESTPKWILCVVGILYSFGIL